MKTTTDNNLGFLLWIAASMAETIQQPGYDGPALDQSPKESIGWFFPHMYDEQMESIEDFANLYDSILAMENEDPRQESLFNEDFMHQWSILHEMVKKGRIASIVCIHETIWGVYGDHDMEVGAMIDPAFLLTFHEKMLKAKHPVMWRNGPFLVVVDSKDVAALIG